MVVTILLVFGLAGAVVADTEAPECSRYSLQEFYASVFWPAFDARILFLDDFIDQSVAGAEEMLIGLEERKSGEKDIEGVKLSLNRVQQDCKLSLHKSKFMISDAWSEALSVSSEKSSLVDKLVNIVDFLKSSNDGFSESFQGVTDSVQSVMNTMVQLIVSGMQKHPPENLDTIKKNFVKTTETRGKLLGRIIANLVLAEIDKQPIRPTKVMIDAVAIVEDLLEDLKSNETLLEDFWKTYLPLAWNQNNEKRLDKQDVSVEQEIINLLSSLFYNSGDKSLFLPQDD